VAVQVVKLLQPLTDDVVAKLSEGDIGVSFVGLQNLLEFGAGVVNF